MVTKSADRAQSTAFTGASAHPEIANAAANDENRSRQKSGRADT
jgi:hypothetical protein